MRDMILGSCRKAAMAMITSVSSAAAAPAAPAASAAVAGASFQIHRPCSAHAFFSLGMRALPGVGLSQNSSSRSLSSLPRTSRVLCQAAEKDKVDGARKSQIEATEVLAELLKANDVRAVAQAHVKSLSENFFIIASTYLDLAKKEGNVEVVNKLETTLKTALSVKEATLRPEIRLLNLLLRQKTEQERTAQMEEDKRLLTADSYFFELLAKMTGDVEKQTNNKRRMQLLVQLRIINKETKLFCKALTRGKGAGAEVEPDLGFP